MVGLPSVETAWVLSRAYKLSREQVVEALEGLLRSREIVVDDGADVLRALRTFQSGSADFADCLIEHAARRAGCEETVTFEAHAAKSAGTTLLEA